MKDLFVSFDYIGFDEIYIVFEYLVLFFVLFGEVYWFFFFNVYFGSERIDVCLIEDGIIVEKFGIIYSKLVLDKVIVCVEIVLSF